MTAIDWMQEIHGENPYEGFPVDELAMDLQGWGADSPIFEHVVSTYRPSRMIEVGTWKGASAIKTAELMKHYHIPEPQLICVDTWLGSLEHWLNRNNPTFFASLALKWGRPDLYNTFLANVVRAGHADVIVPFPVDTSTAAKFFLRKGMQADAIYLDASHEYENVIADLVAYWEMLRPGGVLIGDDFDSKQWPGVVRAVREFAECVGHQVNTSFFYKYLIEKNPGCSRPSLSVQSKGTVMPQGRQTTGEIHVINLDRSTARWTNFKARNAHLGQFERFSAVDGNAINRSSLEREGAIAPGLNYSPGQLGGALSHIKLLHKAVAERVPLTIFEDDALSHPAFNEHRTAVSAQLPDDWDIILWGYIYDPLFLWIDWGFSSCELRLYDRAQAFTWSDTSNGRSMYLPLKLKHAFGLQAYSISPRGAKRFLTALLPLKARFIPFPGTNIVIADEGIDCAMNLVYPKAGSFICIPPLVVEQDDGVSEIGEHKTV